MFGPVGVYELLFILGLALVIFGPRKLPEIGRTLGKGIAEFRKASNELKRTLNTEVLREEIRQNDPRRILRDAVEEPSKEGGAKKEGGAETAGKNAEPAAGKPAFPEGTVSRSGTSGASSEDEGLAEPAAQALPSSSPR